MTAINFALLTGGVADSRMTSIPQVARPTAPMAAENRFAAAMARAGGANAPHEVFRSYQVAANGPIAPTDAAAASGKLDDAQERARKTLKLDAPKAVTKSDSAGDSILDGLQKLRGVFDAEQSRVNAALSASPTNASDLIALQVEVVNFSLLVDVTSKLTGKSTQALETLLKGQ